MHPHKILHVDACLVDKALSLWQLGQLVAFPTETVYGLGADATNGEAVARIYAVKSRPQFNPLIVHVADADAAKRYAEWNPLAEALSGAFWPGPLTLVLKRRANCAISSLVSAGGDTIALRVPAHPVAQALLRAWDGGIAAPSANRSGRVSPTTATHVHEELGSAIPLIIDGGACTVGIESTVVDCTGDRAVILRPGTITQENIAACVPLASTHTSGMAGGVILAPGQLASHYAPSIPVRCQATSVGPNEALLAFGSPVLQGAARTLNLSAKGDLLEAAANLFAYLRTLDDAAYAAIAVMPIPKEEIGIAINDRLRRAAYQPH